MLERIEAEKEELRTFAASLIATLERQVAAIEQDRMLVQLTEEAA